MEGRWFVFMLGVAATLMAALFVTLAIAYGGIYNIAASEDHSAFVRWALATSMQTSVRGRADDVEAPRLTDEMAAAGAHDYKRMCEHCHGGPAVPHAHWTQGMLPQPPSLVEEATEWSAQELFWLIKHGVKMSGMPAFGGSHDDESIWRIVAFVDRLPGMTPERYRRHGGADEQTSGPEPAAQAGH